ncbi:MAG TPA: hypothetical protein VFY73_22645 [Ideonella sp.]|uniref:hypothetical protein n=1 Tax=Ideonella sp. TaxID=1929293 RepID=UPI002E35A8FF|nr:hypothetical protein [Ideonella sp.]HEX5686818.1 hypothetical protein [Ideonella sp.]
MNEYILFMLNDAADSLAANDGARWGHYMAELRQGGRFDGGSAIGIGGRFRKGRPAQPANAELTGFIRVRAENLEDAKRFLIGNPTYEAGGTVEIRELPRE